MPKHELLMVLSDAGVVKHSNPLHELLLSWVKLRNLAEGLPGQELGGRENPSHRWMVREDRIRR